MDPNKFLSELAKLCKKYNVKIYGCGCCGSPIVEDHKDDKEYINLIVNEQGGRLEVREFKSPPIIVGQDPYHKEN